MKPARFEYVRARDVPHALEVLARGDAKVLAGGQSLMPMVNFRLVTPGVMLDINRIPDLDGIEAQGDRVNIGALVRHRQTLADPVIAERFPVLRQAMAHVAHDAVRNRGTFIGSLCHADPAAEMPMLALLLEARITVASARGQRQIDAADFFLAPLTTALEPDELAVRADLPNLPPGTGWGFEEFARRHGDFALAAVAVTLRRNNGRAVDVRIAAMGIGDTARRLPAAEAALGGKDLDALPAAISAIRAAVEPGTDQHASAEYRRHLIGVLAQRAITAAWERAAA